MIYSDLHLENNDIYNIQKYDIDKAARILSQSFMITQCLNILFLMTHIEKEN